MLNGDGTPESTKKIIRSNSKKKNDFARTAHFFVHFFAVVVAT